MQDTELLRYNRHIMLPDIDIVGQEKLLASRLLIVGIGGLGSPIALYLAAAGVGTITIIDDDAVDLSNLQRQIAHQEADIGRAKVASAKDAMLALNADIQVLARRERLTKTVLEALSVELDLVVDATDNFATRFLINEVCVKAKIPAVFGAAVQWEGQILIYDPSQNAACYQCLYKDANDTALNCAENGVAAPVVGIIGTMQAMEAIRLLLNIGESSAGELQTFDAQQMQWRKFKLPKNPHCPACG